MPKVNTPEIENKSISREKLSDNVNISLDGIGVLSSLQTGNKTDIVNSINELYNICK